MSSLAWRGVCVVVASATLVALVGCGPTCRDLRWRLANPPGRAAAPGPHARVVLPFAAANRSIALVLSRVPSVPITLPSALGSVATRILGKPVVRVARLSIGPAPDGHVSLAGSIELADKRGRLLALELRGQLEASVRRESSGGPAQLHIGIPDDAQRRLSVKLEPDAARLLAGRLYQRLPLVLRLVVKRAQVKRLASGLVDLLTGTEAGTVQRRVLSWASRLGLFRVDLPNVPLAGARVRSLRRGNAALVVDLTLALPVRRTLGAALPGRAARATGEVEVQVRGSAVAELANWAMKNGHLPRRYDARGRPRAEGAYHPRFDWVTGDERPLHLALYRLSSPCALIRASARPDVRLEGKRLVVKMLRKKIDDVDAGLLGRLSLLVDGLGRRAVKTSRGRAAVRRIRVADQQVELALTRAALTNDELRLGFRVDAPKGRGYAWLR